MIPLPPPIAAEIVRSVTPRDFKEKGVVEKVLKGDHYVIKVPSGNLTVQTVTDRLIPGTAVLVTRHDQQIEIQPLPVPVSRGDSIDLSATDLDLGTDRDTRKLIHIIERISEELKNPASFRFINRQLGFVADILRQNSHILTAETQALAGRLIEYKTSETERSPASFQAGNPALDQLNMLLSALQEKLAALDERLPVPGTLTVDAEDGFIHFNTVREARSWLSEADPRARIAPIHSETAGGAAIVRISTQDDGAAHAAILTKEKAIAELQQFMHGELKSPLWNTLKPSILFEILEMRGALSTEALSTIDRYLEQEAPRHSSEPQPSPALEQAMKQWLGIVLDTSRISDSLARRVPRGSAADIAAQWQAIMRLLGPADEIGVELSFEKYPPAKPVQDAIGLSPDIIQQAFARLGMNLEHIMSDTISGPENRAAPDSLKMQLLLLLARMMSAGNETAGISVQESALSTAFSHELNSFFEPIISDIHSIVNRAAAHFSELEQALSSIAETYVEKLSGISNSASDLITGALSQIRHVLPHIPEQPQDSLSLIRGQFSALSVLVPDIAQQNTDVIGRFRQEIEHLIRQITSLLPGVRDSSEECVMKFKADYPARLSGMLNRFQDIILEHKPDSASSTGSTDAQSFAANMVSSRLSQTLDTIFGLIAHDNDVLSAHGFSLPHGISDTPSPQTDFSGIHRTTEPVEQYWLRAFNAAEETVGRMSGEIEEKISQASGEVMKLLEPAHTDAAISAEALQSADHHIGRLSEEIQRVIQNINQEIQRAFVRSAAEEEDSLIRRETSHLNRFLNRISREVESETRHVSRLLESALSRERLSSDTLFPALRQQLEQTLVRLESLQLLARPTTMPEGQQQIVVLPVRIDGQWSDIRVRLIKSKPKSSGHSRNKRFCVHIDVSPANSGPIAVQMDYLSKKSLSVTMHFDRDAARKWFETNRETLVNTLQHLGFKQVSLDFRRSVSPLPSAEQKTSLPTTDSSRIDIRA